MLLCGAPAPRCGRLPHQTPAALPCPLLLLHFPGCGAGARRLGVGAADRHRRAAAAGPRRRAAGRAVPLRVGAGRRPDRGQPPAGCALAVCSLGEGLPKTSCWLVQKGALVALMPWYCAFMDQPDVIPSHTHRVMLFGASRGQRLDIRDLSSSEQMIFFPFFSPRVVFFSCCVIV